MKEYILISTSNFPNGGASASFLNLLCKGFNENNKKISVWLLQGHTYKNFDTSNTKNGITESGIEYKYFCSVQRPVNVVLKLYNDITSIIVLFINLLYNFNKRNNLHYIIYNSQFAFNLPIFIIAKIFRTKITLIVSEYYDKSAFRGGFFRPIKWYLFLMGFNYLNSFSDYLIVFSTFLKNKYVNLGFKEKNILLLPNLTDFSYWENTNNDINRYTIGYSGTPLLKDGLFDLLNAVYELKKRNIIVSVVIVGDSKFGKSLLPPIIDMCKELKIEKLVTFTGLVELNEVKNILNQCTILAITRPNITQTMAGFPTKLGEYCALRKPILSTNFGDIEKYFNDKQDIILAECGDPIDIANKAEWIINNYNESLTIANNAYNTGYKLFDYKDVVYNIANNSFLST